MAISIIGKQRLETAKKNDAGAGLYIARVDSAGVLTKLDSKRGLQATCQHIYNDRYAQTRFRQKFLSAIKTLD